MTESVCLGEEPTNFLVFKNPFSENISVDLHAPSGLRNQVPHAGWPAAAELDSRAVLEAGGLKSDVSRAILPPMALEKSLAWPPQLGVVAGGPGPALAPCRIPASAFSRVVSPPACLCLDSPQ